MPKLNGIEVAARMQKLEKPAGIIILSMHADESYIIRALAAGARAYLLKSATDEDLLPAVRAVASGKPFSVRRRSRLRAFCLEKARQSA
jgi:two-component system response regulator NreC